MFGSLVDGSSQMFLAIIFAGTLVTLLLIFVGVRGAVAGPRQRMRQRIARIKHQNTAAAADSKPATVIRLSTDYSSIQSFDRLLKRLLPRPALLRKRLAKTGRETSLGTYVLINLLVGTIIGAVMMKILNMSPIVAALFGLAGGLGLPHMVVGMMIERRLKKFLALFPEGIDLMVRGLRSGLPVTESMKSVGEELPDPVGIEFRRITDSLKFGKSIEEALWVVAARLDTPEFKFLIISLSIQQETGGNLAETLENLSEILRKRRQMQLKVKAMSSEARASAMIIGSLPFIMFGLISWVNPGYLSMLFTDPRGIMMVSFTLGLMAIGIFVMHKMVRFEI